MANLPRVYWDSAAWIAYIKKEMPGNDTGFREPRYEMCRAVLDKAVAGEVEITTSAFTLSEVCKKTNDPLSPAVNLPAFFEQPYILLLTVDKQIGMKAQSLQVAGVTGLKPADAIHLASALVWNIPVMHTFDGPLLKLDDVLTTNDGNQFKIVHPKLDEDMDDLFLRGESDGDD